MSEWNNVVLKSLVKKIIDNRGKTPPTIYMGKELLEVNAIGGRSPDYSVVRKFLTDNVYESWFRSGHPQIGDVIVPTVGTIGNVSIMTENRGAIAQNLIALRFIDKVEANYIYYFLCSSEGKSTLLNLDIGGVQPSIKLPHLLGIEIPLPPLPEQRAIAAVLSSLDDKIDLLHRQNKTLEAMAATLFRQWFVEEADESWEEVPLKYVTKRITDGAHASPSSTEIGKPMASVKDMYDWGINFSTCRKISEVDFNKLIQDDCKPLENDILIAKDGSYLKHIFVVREDLDVVILSSIAIIRPNNKYHPILLSILLKLDSTIDLLTNIVTGAVIPRIVLKDFRNFPIVLPPIQVQDKALTIIEPIINKCWNNDDQIRTLEKLRDTLLPKLMSGEVRVDA